MARWVGPIFAMTLSPEVWLSELLDRPLPPEGGEMVVRGQRLVMRDGILRAISRVSAAQKQTERGFAYKWARRDGYDSAAALRRAREWLIERYGDLARAAW